MAVIITGWSGLIPNPEVFCARKGTVQVPVQDLEDLKYKYEERCAILEFDAGFSRKKAEVMSRTILSKACN